MANRHISTKEVPLPLDTIAPYIMSLPQRLTNYLLQGAWTMPNGSVLIRFTTYASMASWGEDIDVTLYRDPTNTRCTAQIKSECSMPTQVIDFGRNKKIVQAIESDIDGIVAMFYRPAQGGANQAPSVNQAQVAAYRAPNPYQGQGGTYQAPTPSSAYQAPNTHQAPMPAGSHQAPSAPQVQTGTYQEPGAYQAQGTTNQIPGAYQTQGNAYQAPVMPQTSGAYQGQGSVPQAPNPYQGQNDTYQAPGPQ